MEALQGEVRITIRFPREVAEALKTLAKQNDRSINGEVVRAVREHLERQQRAKREQVKRDQL
jgi:predicted transcriptional regulator